MDGLDIFIYLWGLYYLVHIILFGRNILKTRCFQERIHFYYNTYKDENIVIKYPHFDDFRIEINEDPNRIEIYEF